MVAAIITPSFTGTPQPEPPPAVAAFAVRNPANAPVLAFRRAFVTFAVWSWEFAQAERFRKQRERELAAAVAHKAVTDMYGKALIPTPTPFHWSADKVAHFASGGVNRTPAFVATVGTRVSAFRKRVGRVAA